MNNARYFGIQEVRATFLRRTHHTAFRGVLLVLLAFLLVCWPLAPHERTAAQAQSTSGGELTLLNSSPTTLDPARASDSDSSRYTVEIFSGLVAVDRQLQVVPDLAESWEIGENGTRYTFKLRANAKFHNGRGVTAEDFKYSLERAADPRTGSLTADTYLGDIRGVKEKLAGLAGEVEGVKVISREVLQIDLVAPRFYFLSKLTYPTAFVVAKENVESGENWADRPIGTGPFKLKEWRKEQSIVLERNDDYYLEPAKLDRVRFLLSGGPTMALYQSNEIDLANVGISALEQLQNPSHPLNKELVSTTALDTWYIGFNTAMPPFDDPKVRQAFSHAIDRDQIINVVLKRSVERANGIVPPSMPGYSSAVRGLDFDPDHARQLVQESKYQDDFPPVTFTVPGGGPAADPVSGALVEQWKANLGIDIDVQQVAWETFLSELKPNPLQGKKNKFQMYQLGWSADYPDPQNFLDPMFHSASFGNNEAYSNPEVDQLLEQARAEGDVEQRNHFYRQAEQIVVDDAPWLPLYHGKAYQLVKPWIKDYAPRPMTVAQFRFVYRDSSWFSTPTAPADGEVLPGLRAALSWSSPAGSTHSRIQVRPELPSAPGLPRLAGFEFIRRGVNSLVIEPPNIEEDSFFLVPGMTYVWRVQSSSSPTPVRAGDPSWGPWSEWRTFRTPLPPGSGIEVVFPASGETVTTDPKVLHWRSDNRTIFMYQVQVSPDPAFGAQGPIAPVWNNIVHGGRSLPLNSWTTPRLRPTTTYHWRVRPWAPGENTTAWSDTWTFTTTHVPVVPLPMGKIVYSAIQGANADIHVINTNGSQTRLTSGGANLSPVWSPDGTKIVFLSREAQTLRLEVMNADGTGRTTLTHAVPPSFTSPPAWSPDGGKIAFLSRSNNIHLISADGSEETALTSNGRAAFPAWSPDGTRIAYLSSESASAPAEVYIRSADGTAEVRVTTGARASSAPSWSPDGSRIAFSGGLNLTVRTSRNDIYTVNADGSDLKNLTSAVLGGVHLSPVWSPEGGTIAFFSVSASSPSAGIFLALDLVTPDGSAVGVSTSDGDPTFGLLILSGIFKPVWAPNGQYLVLPEGAGADVDLYLVNLDGSSRQNITNRPGISAFPAWTQ